MAAIRVRSVAGGAPRISWCTTSAPKGGPQGPACGAPYSTAGVRSAATVTESDYVASPVVTRRDVAGTDVRGTTVQRPGPGVPPFVGPDERHDFVLVGRLGPYKNIDAALEAWQRHVDGERWRGDELVFIGDGPTIRTLPAYARWRPGSYRYADVVTTLAAAKGSVVHYRAASQSGVQLLAMQLGVMPIISSVGGLPEYQPPVFPPVGVDDVAGLTAAFDELSAAHRNPGGAAAARHYADCFHGRSRRGGAFWNVLNEVGGRIRKRVKNERGSRGKPWVATQQRRSWSSGRGSGDGSGRVRGTMIRASC